MNMKRKLICGLLCLSMVLSLAACGGSKEDTSNSADTFVYVPTYTQMSQNFENGIYTTVDSYTGGTQLAHRGTMTGNGKPGRPDGAEPMDGKEPPADGERPQRNDQNGQRPERPADGERPADAPEPPADGAIPDRAPQQPGSSYDTAAEQSAEFTLGSDSRVFAGITPLENSDTADTQTEAAAE